VGALGLGTLSGEQVTAAMSRPARGSGRRPQGPLPVPRTGCPSTSQPPSPLREIPAVLSLMPIGGPLWPPVAGVLRRPSTERTHQLRRASQAELLLIPSSLGIPLLFLLLEWVAENVLLF